MLIVLQQNVQVFSRSETVRVISFSRMKHSHFIDIFTEKLHLFRELSGDPVYIDCMDIQISCSGNMVDSAYSILCIA